MTHLAIDLLTERLKRCRQVGHQRWMACCPAHEDKSPSLSITVNERGMILIHCHAGCDAQAVIAATGLKWADLFTDEWDAAYGAAVHHKHSMKPIDPLEHELTIVELARADLRSGKVLSLEDMARVKVAIERLGGDAHD